MPKGKMKAPEPYEYKPRMYFDLNTKDEVEMAKEVKIGETVTIVAKGKVVSISQRQEDKKVEGSISVEDYKIERIDNGMFSQLAED